MSYLLYIIAPPIVIYFSFFFFFTSMYIYFFIVVPMLKRVQYLKKNLNYSKHLYIITIITIIPHEVHIISTKYYMIIITYYTGYASLTKTSCCVWNLRLPIQISCRRNTPQSDDVQPRAGSSLYNIIFDDDTFVNRFLGLIYCSFTISVFVFL